MQGEDAIAQRVEALTRGFDQELYFSVAMNCTLPAISRNDALHAINAGRESCLDNRYGDTVGNRFVRTGAENDQGAHAGIIRFCMAKIDQRSRLALESLSGGPIYQALRYAPFAGALCTAKIGTHCG